MREHGPDDFHSSQPRNRPSDSEKTATRRFYRSAGACCADGVEDAVHRSRQSKRGAGSMFVSHIAGLLGSCGRSGPSCLMTVTLLLIFVVTGVSDQVGSNVPSPPSDWVPRHALRSAQRQCVQLRGGSQPGFTDTQSAQDALLSGGMVPRNGEPALAFKFAEVVAAEASPSEARPRHWPPGVHTQPRRPEESTSGQPWSAGQGQGGGSDPVQRQAGESSGGFRTGAPWQSPAGPNALSQPPRMGYGQYPRLGEAGCVSAIAELQGKVRARVPEGVVPGQYLQVTIPNRGATRVQVPAGAVPGQELEIRYALPAPGPSAQLRSVTVTVPVGVVAGQQLDVRVGADSMLVQVPEGVVAGQQLLVRYWTPGNGDEQYPNPGSGGGSGQQGWHGGRGAWSRAGGGRTDIGGGRTDPGWAPIGLSANGRPKYYPTRGRPPGSTRSSILNRPPSMPPNANQLVRRLVLANQSKQRAMELAAQYDVSLFIVSTASLALVDPNRGTARRRSNPIDPVQIMMVHLQSQLPSRAVVLVDIRNETLSTRIARSLQLSGRHIAHPFYRWQEVQRVDMVVNTTKLTDNGAEYIWRCTERGWGWVDPDTMEMVEDILEVANRSVVCYAPETPSGHKWVHVLDQLLVVDIDSGPYSAYALFRLAIKDEVLHELAQLKLKAEEEQKQRRLHREMLEDCTLGLELVRNEHVSDSDKVKQLSELVRRQPRLVQCFLGNGWNAVFRCFDSPPELTRASQAIQTMRDYLNMSQDESGRTASAESEVGGGSDAVDEAENGQAGGVNRKFTRLVAEKWNALAGEARQELSNLAAELESERQVAVERRLEEERRRRQQSYSLALSSPKRQSVFRRDQDYVPTDRAFIARSPNRRMRRSWRAAVLYSVVMLNATAPDSGVTKTDVLEWVNTQRHDLTAEAPIYLGIHLSNLCRDGILFSVRGASCKGKETVYFAKEGAGELVTKGDDVWPKGRRSSGPLPRHARPRSPPRMERRAEGRERQERQQELLRLNAVCKARRARFVLDRWDKFAPFLEDKDKPLDGPLARKLDGLEQSAVLAGHDVSNDKPQVPVRGQPECIVGDSMREYQVAGLKWLVHQHDRSAGGILGDEMGLGKTLQMISFFGFLKTVRGEHGPHLVVAPLSVMNAWVGECEKWCPALKVVTFHGSVAERERIRHEVLSKLNFDVCVTTYEMLVADLHGLVQRNVWNYVVMDEAHRIKNEHSQLGQAVRKLRCNNRMLITGTPLQNNLHELWSLLNILFPEALGSSSLFDASFRIAALYHNTESPQQIVDADLMSSAHALLQPLMLRRLKKDVLSMELPPKVEKKIMVPLSSMQRFLYAGMLKQDVGMLLEKSNRKFATEHARLNSLLMQLRKLCNHPYMFPAMDPMVTDERIVESSSKLMVLDKILAKLKQEGRRALIYSQFTSMLDVIGDFLSYRGYKFLRLDGSTPPARRRYEIACFENPRSQHFLYLISTRAGGLGITLVAADTVILFDSDWNPTADQQAMDRVHRIGQKRTVHCYRLVSQGTVEERIVQAAQNKLNMNAIVMRDDVSNPNEDDSTTGRQPITEVLRTLREGLKCVSSQDNSNKSFASLTADEILDAAETKVISGRPQDEEETKIAADEEGAGEKAGDIGRGSSGDVAEESATAQDAEDTADVLGEIFSSLPTIRQFEGKEYSSKKDSFRDLADEWAAQYDGKARQSKGRVVQVGDESVMAWSLKGEDSKEQGASATPQKPKGGFKFKHRRRCQRCKRCAGSMLFCARCPVVMHRFCVVAEGYEDDSEEEDQHEMSEERSQESDAGETWQGRLRSTSAHGDEPSPEHEDEQHIDADGGRLGALKEHVPETTEVKREYGFLSGAVKDLKDAVSNWARAKNGDAPLPTATDAMNVSDDVGANTSQPDLGGQNETAGADDAERMKMPEMEAILCGQLLNRLMKRKDSIPFLKPVDPARDLCADYFDVIKKPMDLTTVHRKLREGAFRTVPDFSSDVRLVFSNSMTYNPPNHTLYKQARRLRKFFWEMCTELGLQIQRLATVGDWPHDYAVLLKRMIKNKDAKPFAEPVDPDRDGCPDYADVIKQPMDLGTVIDGLNSGLYAGPEEMAEEVRRTFNNAMTYNPKKHALHISARKMLRNFEEHFGKLQKPQPRSASDAANDDEDNFVPPNRTQARWICPHHRCAVTQRPATDCGGMLFRCWDCPAAYSDDCLEDGFEPVDVSFAFRGLEYSPPTSAEYIRCAKCVEKYPNASLTPPEEAPIEVDGDTISEVNDDTEVASDRDSSTMVPSKAGGRQRGAKKREAPTPRKALNFGDTESKDVSMLNLDSGDAEFAEESSEDQDWSSKMTPSGSAKSNSLRVSLNGGRSTRSATRLKRAQDSLTPNGAIKKKRKDAEGSTRESNTTYNGAARRSARRVSTTSR